MLIEFFIENMNKYDIKNALVKLTVKLAKVVLLHHYWPFMFNLIIVYNIRLYIWIVWIMDWSLYFSAHYCMLYIKYKTLCWFPTDNEYLHKRKDGNVYLHNVETMASSLYLSNSTFVRLHTVFSFHFQYVLIKHALMY